MTFLSLEVGYSIFLLCNIGLFIISNVNYWVGLDHSNRKSKTFSTPGHRVRSKVSRSQTAEEVLFQGNDS